MKTAADIAAARIIALGLAGPPIGGAVDVARHLLCTQAQALPGALASVALRTADRDLTGVVAALNEARVVRSWTQRGTIHLVAAGDLGWILNLTGPRMLTASEQRRAELGIDSALIDRAAAIATDLIRTRGPVTRAALIDALAEVGIGRVPGREYWLITTLAFRQVIVQGPMAGGRRTEQLFAVSDDWIGPARTLTRDDAVAELMTRYARGHGPVTVADAARWTGLTKTDARRGLDAGRETGALDTTDIDGNTYFHAPDLPDRLADHRAAAHEVHLLPGFDELILGYKDRTMTLSAADERLVVPGGNGIFKATVVSRGRAVGTWVRSPRRSGPQVLVTPFPRRRINGRGVEHAARGHPSFARP